MNWADAVPNLVIGLREGLEAGLVVSILLAAFHKTAESAGGRRSTAPIWLGVLGAVAVSGSFAAVLTSSTELLTSSAQEAVGGLLSVVAVGLVTAMIFWMRSTAAGLSAQLRGEVDRALRIGTGALALTAFLAVGREGLETTLFLWTAVRASGQTVTPLIGAATGLALAVAGCRLLYRRAIRINLGVFFNRTAVLLIVIAAGILSYGLGDLQDAGLLPGRSWIAFDISSHIDTGSWWVSIVSGVTELTPSMTVLQVTAWTAYLIIVLTLFLRSRKAVPTPTAQAAAGRTSRWERLAGRRPWAVAGVVVVLPVLAATASVAVLPRGGAGTQSTITVTPTACATGWTAPPSGRQSISVANRSGRTGEINLVDAAGAVVSEIETIGPSTTADMTAVLTAGSYRIRCAMSGAAPMFSPMVQVSGPAGQRAPTAVIPVTVAELDGPNRAYQAYAAGRLAILQRDVTALRSALAAGDLGAARSQWLVAQLDWERVGASYNSFGDAGTAVDGLPDGLPLGVADPGFTGLHRLEYGLFHGQSAASLLPVAAQLTTDVAAVAGNLTGDDIAGDPTNLPLRAHEILEDALRDHLSGLDDQGGGGGYAETYADTQATAAVLGELTALVDRRAPGLVATAHTQLATLQGALTATERDGRWRPPSAVPPAQRRAVNAATGAVLETLSAVPDLLELRTPIPAESSGPR
jgi:high-affinity iron transporter